MHKKYHEKFKILDILAVTTQAHEGIETQYPCNILASSSACPRQKNGKKQEAKGENTMQRFITDERTGIRYEHPVPVPGKKV